MSDLDWNDPDFMVGWTGRTGKRRKGRAADRAERQVRASQLPPPDGTLVIGGRVITVRNVNDTYSDLQIEYKGRFRSATVTSEAQAERFIKDNWNNF